MLMLYQLHPHSVGTGIYRSDDSRGRAHAVQEVGIKESSKAEPFVPILSPTIRLYFAPKHMKSPTIGESHFLSPIVTLL